MALNFPSSPATNDTFTSGGITWIYNGSSWTTNRIESTFDTLSDVNLTGAANNDLIYRSGGAWIDTAGQLTWDGSTFLATAGTISGASIVALSNTMEVQGTFPFLQLNQTDGATDQKKWVWIYDNAALEMRAVNDASDAYSQAFVMSRSGYAISSLTFGNATDNPTFTFSGTGLTTVGGNLTVVGTIGGKAGTVSAPSIHFSDTTTGFYKAAADSIGVTIAGTQRLVFDSTGIVTASAKFYGPGGSAASPTYSFVSDNNSGMYSNNSGTVYIVSDGTARLTVDSNGITVNGTVSASSVVSTGSSMEIQGSFPYLQLNQTDGGTDEKKWVWIADGTAMELRATNDASSAYTNAFTFTRSAQNLSNLTFGNATSNPTYTFAGTGAISGVGSGLTSLTAANISSGNLGSGVLPYATASASNSEFQVPFLNTTGTSSGNFGLLLDSSSPLLYNPSSGVLTATILSAGALYVDTKLILDLPSNSSERGPWNPIATAIIQSGRRIHNDPEFKNGANSISVYDNSGTGQISITHGTAASLDAGFAAPNSTGNIVEISWTGVSNPEPNDGGWTQLFTAEENHTFAQVILAKAPSGCTISIHENSQGTNATSYWLTNNVGTGKYEYYVRVSHCGEGGTFSTSGYVAINNGGSAWTVQVAFQAAYDITEHPELYTINGGSIRAYDSTGSDYIEIAHDGTNANLTGINAANIRFIVNAAEQFSVKDGGASLPLTKSINFYTSDFGIGTPDSSGLQLFTTTGDTIRFGKRPSGTWTEYGKFDSDGTFRLGEAGGTGLLTQRAAGSHITFYETDGPDSADRAIFEINGGEVNIYTHDSSANVWRKPFASNISTGWTVVGSGAQLVLVGPQSGAANLNSYYVDGYAQITFGQVTTGVTNAPEAPDNANFILSLESHGGGYGRQFYYPDNGNCWTRLHQNGSWGSWRRFALQDSNGQFDTAQTIQLDGTATLPLRVYNAQAGATANTSIHLGYPTEGYGWRITNNNNPSSTYAGNLQFTRGVGTSTYTVAGYFDNSSNFFGNASIVVGTGFAYYLDGGSSITIRYNGSSTYSPIRFEGNKGSYGGFYDTYSATNMMWDSSGNGGEYRESNSQWRTYWSTANACMGIKGSTTSSSYAMYVTGAIYATGDIVAFSDARLKENIYTIEDSLAKVLRLRGANFNRIDDPEKKLQMGVIAQEVLEVCPEVVTHSEKTDSEGNTGEEYGVNYGALVGVLIEAVKELNAKVDAQAKLIEELRNG